MGAIPVPRSPEQILGDIIDAFRSQQGVRNLRVGGPLLSIFEAAMRSDARNAQDIFGLLSAVSLDRATGLALDRIGLDEDVPRIEESPSAGLVTITDSSFTKISSKVFQGSPAPIVGSVAVRVSDASLFPNTGDIYIGRGTPNYEGPLPYSSVTNNGTHWTLTLSSGTTRFHNTSESVVVAQGGNRTIGAGTIVRTQQGNISNAVEFKILYLYNLPDGETSVSNVQVVCQKPGQIGNVSRGDIREFPSEPFTGATVTNPAPFSSGLETEQDDSYRERIKDERASRTAGTSLAITTAVTGITATDENKRVSSASLVKRPGFASTLYIDDGTGYEDVSTGIGMETLVDFAVGGEKFFETSQRPIPRAFVTTVNQAPFSLVTGSNLTVQVGGKSYTHNFDSSDFTSISNASAYEVAASINSNPLLGFLARTSDAGTYVAIFAKEDTNEDIQVVAAEVGDDANESLQFPTGQTFTVQLYKNDRLLSKDGAYAILMGESFSQWSAISGTQTITIAVDNTPALSYSFVDQDFIDADTGYTTVAKNSVDAWVEVINAKIPGITATNESGTIHLTSNAGPTARAAVEITTGTLVTAHLFSTGRETGLSRDYTMDRNLGQIELIVPLVAGDKLTLGSLNSRAFIESPDIVPTTLSAAGQTWFIVDEDAEIVPTGITSGTNVDISIGGVRDWGHILSITASSGTPFANVQAGDWIILWDPALDPSMHGAHRVVEVQTDTLIKIERRDCTTVRSGHATVALDAVGVDTSNVLTTGGSVLPISGLGNSVQAVGATDTCEIFDPATRKSSPCAPMGTERVWHTATKLDDGTVLVVGGLDGDGTPLNTLEIYDPTLDTWTASAATTTLGVYNHTATLLTNGRVLIAGGDNGTGAINQFHVYNPAGDAMSTTGTMGTARARHRAVKMPNDNVFVSGGYDGARSDLLSCETFSAGGLSFAASSSMNRARSGHGMALIGTVPTKILVAGNHSGVAGNTTYEEYTFGTDTWGAETTIPNDLKFEDKDLLRISNGNVIAMHGFTTASPTIGDGFSYDGATFTSIGSNGTSTDSSTKWRSTYAELTNLATTVENIVVGIGGSQILSTAWNYQPSAMIDVFDEDAMTWSNQDEAALLSNPRTLSASGLVVVRSQGVIQQIEIPAGANYTASTLAGVLNADNDAPGLTSAVLGPGLRGATASVYRTKKVRASTNTHDIDGRIALVAQDENAADFGMTPGASVENLVGHVGSVESNQETGTPDFKESRILGVSKGTPEQVVVDVATTSLGNSLVGLRDWQRGVNSGSTSIYAFAASRYPRTYTNYNSRTRLKSMAEGGQLVRLEPRSYPVQSWKPLSRAYLAAPFAMTANDDLTVIVDQEIEKRFAIRMGRLLTTVGTTYASTNTFKDGDSGSLSLAETFGLEFDFNDFAVHMPSRAIGYSGDATRSMLFRYYRLGPEGDVARVRFGNPTGPDLPLAVDVSTANIDHVDVTFRIASGAERTPPGIHPSTTLLSIGQTSVSGGIEERIFVANLRISTASRTTNVVMATTTMPAGVTNHGLQVAEKVWVQSTDVNFSSGLKTLTARTDTTFSYAEVAADIGATANIGTVSRDTAAEASFTASGIVDGDFIDIDGEGQTYRISSVDGSGGWVKATSGDNGTYIASSTGELLTVDEFHSVFAGSAQSVTAIVAAINALAAAEDSICPVTAIVLGTGAGTIDQSSPDSYGDSTEWFSLADGLNWVRTTTPPGTIAGDYDLTFKKPVTGSLSTGSDWANETVKIVPTTAKNVVDWLNAPAVSGLFTVCTIKASDDARRVQISSKTPGSTAGVQVQGGSANSVSSAVVGSSFTESFDRDVAIVPALDVTGMNAGQWARIDNENGVPLSGFFSGIDLVSWTTGGLLTFGSPIIFGTPVQCKVNIEAQGKYLAISDMGMGIALEPFDTGYMVRISPATSPTVGMDQVSTANQGIFRVLRADYTNTRSSSGTMWIENTLGIEEQVECMVTVYPNNTPVAGDKLAISDPAWGVENQGVWTISAVGETTPGAGDLYANDDTITVDVSSRVPYAQGAAAALTTAQAGLIYPLEGTPASFIKKIYGIYPNQDDGAFANIVWTDMTGYSTINAAAGSVITILDKLAFPIDVSPGIDAYRYNTGLIGEANKVVEGDPADTATYPGVAADGSRINICGPLVKRIKIALLLRVRSTGVTNTDVGDRVRSSVATAVNQSAIGEPIAISSIVSAAQKVVGVQAVTVLSPAYNAGNDLIPVQPYEKALVLDLDTDIQITYSGD